MPACPADVAELVARARAAQPGWEALGFEGRARDPQARAEVGDRQLRAHRSSTIVAETGKAYEDAQLAEVAYAAGAFGFWAKNAEKYLADEKVRIQLAVRAGQQAGRALRARAAWSA